MTKSKRYRSNRLLESTLPAVAKSAQPKLLAGAFGTRNQVAQARAAESEACKILALAQTISRIYDRSLASMGLRISQFAILAVLNKSGPLSTADLSRIMGVSGPSAIRNLGILHRQGLLSTASSERTGHRTFLITKNGLLALSLSYPLWRNAQQSATRLLGRDGCRALEFVMQRLRSESHARRE